MARINHISNLFAAHGFYKSIFQCYTTIHGYVTFLLVGVDFKAAVGVAIVSPRAVI
jgi:hypothetical protein